MPWIAPPEMPSTHYLDNRIYTDAAIFALEREWIFAKCWKFLCHESEIGNRGGDYRTATLAGIPLIVLRDAAGTVRAYYNICPHRGAASAQGERRGRSRTTESSASTISGRSTRRDAASTSPRPAPTSRWVSIATKWGLRPVRVELFCGMVFVCLDDDAPPLAGDPGAGSGRHARGPLEARPLKVFHYHRAEIRGQLEAVRERPIRRAITSCSTSSIAAPAWAARDTRKRRWETHEGGRRQHLPPGR